MTVFEEVKKNLSNKTYTWLITGVAGFIGSHLLETLLKLNQKVIGLDNFATGFQHNLDEVKTLVAPEQWANFTFIEGDICQFEDCQRAVSNVDFVLHEAALGSVPRSLKDPIKTNDVNISGFLNMLVAARDAKVKRFIFAASSSTYGDHPGLPKVEDKIGKPLSPYAVTKYVNELYADVFARCYGLKYIGLRYFNVFGPRQHPEGAYAAVIPKWIGKMMQGQTVEIYGDGETSRDFTYVENVIQINLLAALTENQAAVNQIYNVAVGERTTLNQLFESLRKIIGERRPEVLALKQEYKDFRAGDVRHSLAEIHKAETLLGYRPTHLIADGLKYSVSWFEQNKKQGKV